MNKDNNVDLQGRPAKELFDAINEALQGVDTESINPDASGFRDLPDGYFLLEVKDAKFGFSKTSGNPQISMRFQVVEDGLDMDVDKSGNTIFKTIKKTKGQNIYKHYPMTDGDKAQRFANDMVKFEGDEPGKPLLEKEAFTDADLLYDSLEVLVDMNSRVWSRNDVTVKEDGSKSSWLNLISWARAKDLGLPTE